MSLGLLALTSACQARSTEDAAYALPPCVYLARDDGTTRIAIPYAGQTCDRPGYVTITEPLYDPISKWSFNAQHYGVISVLTAFQIRARLATLDERSSGGFGILGLKILAEYQWPEHLKFADLFLLGGLNDDAAATRLIEQPVADLRLGSGHGIDFIPRRGSLTASNQAELRNVLARAEVAVAHDPRIATVPKTLQEAVGHDPAYAEQRRKNLGAFRVE